MKIRALSLHGFKSFADRTRIDFHPGITAIVGPNGCGKSNISDALRWVLGEQRPSAIRGSRMEEAIFQGTAQRKPIHRAEVSLELSNEDGILSVPYDEVAIGRTVLRGGESIYALNEQTVRLKDIHDLCRDTGLGANAYSIIESRMIDAILSDRAEERRSLFEEAAEVGRYKDRRRTALRRLEQAEQDLRRLEDVLGEVGSKVRSLARQRGRARKYGELRERRLQLEVAVADARLRAIEARLGEVDASLAEARRTRPEEEARLAREETEVEALRLHLVEREKGRSAAAARLEQVRARLEELERGRMLADERIASARARLEAIRAERAGIVERREGLESERVEVTEAAEKVEAALVELRTREAELAAEVEERRDRRRDLEAEEGTAREELARLISEIGAAGAASEARRERDRERARELERRREQRTEDAAAVEALEGELRAREAEASEAEAGRAELEERLGRERVAERESRDRERELRARLAELEGELSAVTARAGALASILASGRDRPGVVTRLLEEGEASAGVRGVLADFLDVPKAAASAVEAHLGSALHAVVVDDWEAVLRIRAWLSGQKEADGLLVLPLDPGPRETGRPGDLLDRVEVRGAGAPWARALLGGVAARDAGFEPAREAWVAADGSGQDALGVVRLGQPAGGRGVLRRRAEHAELEARRADLETATDEARAALEEAAARTAGLSERASATDRELETAASRARASATARDTTSERLERVRGHLAEVDARIGELERERSEADPAREAGDERIADLEARRAEVEAGLAAHRAGLLEVTAAWERESAALQDLRLSIARREAEAAGVGDRARRLQALAEELAAREEKLEDERRRLEETIVGGRAHLEESAEDLSTLFEERAALDAALRTAQAELDVHRAEAEDREAAVRALRQEERQSTERLHALELESTRLRGTRATIRERLEAEWEEEFESLRARVEPPGDGEPEGWAHELERVREDLASIGPVNLLASAEYDEEKERLDFLQEQKQDLEAARNDLLDSIRRINESASAAFQDVFAEVRENFRRIFVTLFEGGEADVWLEDPDDPLDAPIEISASPRGKRTQRIHLLSGGERALTALALLFAIYLTKPSPFCVMDEVDAPLDESNIGRFTAMLERFKESTQFIVITHNARTIEAADYIYGVTMQEPGVSTIVAMDLKDLPRGQVA
jgi:chromosome segregation protein